jgi:hypothetical protein
MHPYLAEQAAREHMADLHREALATCCARRGDRSSLRDRLAAQLSRLAVALPRPQRASHTLRGCCPA